MSKGTGRRPEQGAILKRTLLIGVLAGCGIPGLAPGPVRGQETGPSATDRLNVFLSCEAEGCDADALRDGIGWVHWVAVPDSADVRVTLIRRSVGSGAGTWVLDFDPADGLAAAPDQLSFRSPAGLTATAERDGLATTLGIGLARYSTIAGFREFVVVRPVRSPGIDPNERVVSAQEVDDPWDFWVFNVSGRGDFSGSDTRKTRRLNTSFSANRTTPTWKFSFSGRANFNTQEIERSDGSVFESDEKDINLNTGITYALAEHWSVNLSNLTAKLPRFNQLFHVSLTPGIEYSLFPYEEATRRSVTFRYTVGFAHRRYEEETIFGKMRETPWEEELRLRATMRQPWGDLSASATASHYLDDIQKYNVSFRGDVSFRIVRGLRFNAGGDISRVRDQIYLSAGGITDEEALLRLRTQQSLSNKGLTFGLSWQFGSIYNNTVNNRFPGVGTTGGGPPGGRGGGGGGAP
jgi:hypothetical protein